MTTRIAKGAHIGDSLTAITASQSFAKTVGIRRTSVVSRISNTFSVSSVLGYVTIRELETAGEKLPELCTEYCDALEITSPRQRLRILEGLAVAVASGDTHLEDIQHGIDNKIPPPNSLLKKYEPAIS